MNKNLLSVAIFPVNVNGSVTDPFESEREIDIITDSSFYLLEDEVKIKVSFKNDLLRDVRIVNDNCRVPEFILEKRVEENWERVYLSDCSGIPIRYVSPTILQSMHTFNAEVYIYTSDIHNEAIEGEYRLIFNLIEKESNGRLPDKYLYSNIFRIIKEI
jgi:hypothetical protein